MPRPKSPLPSLTYPISDYDEHTALAATDLTIGPGDEPAIGLHNARLDYEAAARLRNWLSDWLGHHRVVEPTIGDQHRIIKWTNIRG